MTLDGVVWWIVVPLAALVAELVAVLTGKGTPLTAVVRRYLLGTRWGSALVGSGIVWLGFHWLADNGGLAWAEDGTALLVGGILGLAGHYWRHRRDEDG